MARIDVLPSIEIIRGFKGILDFYLWRGLPCVRAWPKYRPARQTDASLAAALLFGAIIKAFALTHHAVLEQLALETIGIPRTARDVTLSGIYGNLHEASMSDFLDALIIIRDAVVAQAALLNALHSLDTDELVVRTEHSVLPDGASTTAAQATQLTALQKIDDLQDALESKALDRLLVRGMDQLHSYNAPLGDRLIGPISGADGYLVSTNPPEGLVWHVTHIAARDQTSPVTEINLTTWIQGQWGFLDVDTRAIAAGESVPFRVNLWLEHDDLIYAFFVGGLIADSCYLDLLGQVFTKET